MSSFRRRIMGRYKSVSIDSTSLVRPLGSIKSLTIVGGDDERDVLVDSEVEYDKADKVTAIYENTNISTTIRYSGFLRPSIITSNSSIISVGALGSETCTITGISNGSATVSVKEGDTIIKVFNITVTNANSSIDVNPTYTSSDTNVMTVDSKSGVVGGGSN